MSNHGEVYQHIHDFEAEFDEVEWQDTKKQPKVIYVTFLNVN